MSRTQSLSSKISKKKQTRKYTVATARKLKAFFVNFRENGSISMSAKAVGLNPQVIYNRRDKDESFRAALLKYSEQATDALEAEAYNRAVVGEDKDVWFQGRKVGIEVIKSDSLLKLLLQANNPDKFNVSRSQVELTGAGGGAVEIQQVQQKLQGQLEQLGIIIDVTPTKVSTD